MGVRCTVLDLAYDMTTATLPDKLTRVLSTSSLCYLVTANLSHSAHAQQLHTSRVYLTRAHIVRTPRLAGDVRGERAAPVPHEVHVCDRR